jgi:hypothetical protein
MWRIVVPFMSPVSVNARRAAWRIDFFRASAVSRRARGDSPAFVDGRVAFMAMGPPAFRLTTK